MIYSGPVLTLPIKTKTKMALLKKKRLLQIGFTHNSEESKGEYTTFDNREFRVRLVKGKKEDPMISIVNPVLGGNKTEGEITFPGAYTMKDLKFIMFFYLGEDAYTKFTENWTEELRIKEFKEFHTTIGNVDFKIKAKQRKPKSS